MKLITRLKNAVANRAQRRLYPAYHGYMLRLARRGKPETPPPGEVGRGLLILTVAFGDDRLIELQIRQLKRHVRDADWQYHVADNSRDAAVRERIKALCQREGVGYHAVPSHHAGRREQRLFLGYSVSHAYALNWAWRHVVAPRRPQLVALLDHDIFPRRPYSFAEHLGAQDFYGVPCHKCDAWYLWPGFALFRYDVVARCGADFMPYILGHDFVDTGGCMYRRLYRHYDEDALRLAPIQTLRLQETPGVEGWIDVLHSDCVQEVDTTWFHLVNGSNYTHHAGREAMIRELLRRQLPHRA